MIAAGIASVLGGYRGPLSAPAWFLALEIFSLSLVAQQASPSTLCDRCITDCEWKPWQKEVEWSDVAVWQLSSAVCARQRG